MLGPESLPFLGTIGGLPGGGGAVILDASAAACLAASSDSQPDDTITRKPTSNRAGTKDNRRGILFSKGALGTAGTVLFFGAREQQ
jgi:hypothetical protein